MNMGKDESEGSRKISESEIAETDETNFGEFKEISENYNGQEEHSDNKSMLNLAVIPMTMLM